MKTTINRNLEALLLKEGHGVVGVGVGEGPVPLSGRYQCVEAREEMSVRVTKKSPTAAEPRPARPLPGPARPLPGPARPLPGPPRPPAAPRWSGDGQH